jgi:GT2 family glycosyltransferase
LENDKNIGICGCRTVTNHGVFEEKLLLNPWFLVSFISKIYKKVNKKQLQKRFDENKNIWYPDWVSGSVILINNKIFKQINGFDDDRYWMYYEELDLCAKTGKLNKNIALLRDVNINHIHGGTTDNNIKTKQITKLEHVISAHNYIYQWTNGYKRIILMSIYIFRTIFSRTLKTIITLPIFWKKSFKINSHILFGILKYYIIAITKRTWKSRRICEK